MKLTNYMSGRIKLGMLLLVPPLLAWGFGYRQTVCLWMECRDDRHHLEKLMANYQDTLLVKEEECFRLPLLDNGKILEYLHPLASANGVRVYKYTPCLTRESEHARIYTGELILSGDFIPLLRTADSLCRMLPALPLLSASFRLFRDVRMREEQLRLTLVFQQLIMI